MSTESLKPVFAHDGEFDLDRKQLAKLLYRTGRGVNCRIDIPVLVLSDIKWAAKTFSELAVTLTQLGWEDKRSDIWLVMAARSAMEHARHELNKTNDKKGATKEFRKHKR